MTNVMPAGYKATPLITYLENLKDYRCARKKPYKVSEMLLCIIIAQLHNCSSLYQQVYWCQNHVDTLHEIGLELKNGVASYVTHSRMLRELDHKAFEEDFMNWTNGILLPVGLHLAIDGKGLRGGTDRIGGANTPYMLNIVETSTGIVIASIAIHEKSNEMSAIPAALSMIAREGNLFTIDAVGTTTPIINALLEGDADFLLLIKRNNPEAYDNVKRYFEKFDNEKVETESELGFDKHDNEKEAHYSCTGWTYENNRERNEYRNCKAMNYGDKSWSQSNPGSLILGPDTALGELSASFKTIGWYQSVRILKIRDENGNDITPSREEFIKNGSPRCKMPMTGDSEKDHIQQIGIVSNMCLSATEILGKKRQHWSCESTHHILDCTFREDENCTRKGKFNASILRKISHNIVRFALFNEDIENHHSTPLSMQAMASSPNLLKKYLFEELDVIRLSNVDNF